MTLLGLDVWSHAQVGVDPGLTIACVNYFSQRIQNPTTEYHRPILEGEVRECTLGHHLVSGLIVHYG